MESDNIRNGIPNKLVNTNVFFKAVITVKKYNCTMKLTVISQMYMLIQLEKSKTIKTNVTVF